MRKQETIVLVDGKVDVAFYRRCFNTYISDAIYERNNFNVDNYYFDYSSLLKAVEYYINNFATEHEIQAYRNQKRKYYQMTKIEVLNDLFKDYQSLLNHDFSRAQRAHKYIFSFATADEWKEFINFIIINYQPIFEIYAQYNGDLSKIIQAISEMSSYANFDIDLFVDCARIYAKHIMKKSLKKFQTRNSNFEDTNAECYEILDKIFNAENSEDISRILSRYDKAYIAKLRAKVSNYAIHIGKKRNLKSNEIDAIAIRLKDKFKEYSMQLNSGLQSKKLTLVEQFFAEFLLSNELLMNDYYLKNGINKSYFYEKLSYLREVNFELYQKVKQKIVDSKKAYRELLIKKAKQFCLWIDNGINSNGVVRQVNIVDYYLYFGISPKVFIHKFPADNNDDICAKIRVFVYQHISDGSMSEITIYNEENITYVNGLRHIVTNAEKAFALHYIETNRLPLNTGTYSSVLSMYLSNSLPNSDTYNTENLQYHL